LRQTHAIYSLFVIGTISSVLLASFWDGTSEVFGSNHSTALFALVFCLSLVDCTSSVLFLPFMAVFRSFSKPIKKKYLKTPRDPLQNLIKILL
jgi:hypothetical protein